METDDQQNIESQINAVNNDGESFTKQEEHCLPADFASISVSGVQGQDTTSAVEQGAQPQDAKSAVEEVQKDGESAVEQGVQRQDVANFCHQESDDHSVGISNSASSGGEPSIISLKQSITLEYCKDADCDCGHVHCPFCDVDHYKPAKPSKVRDHMELKHFAHAVQYNDLLIVKCFKVCDGKACGHYHCPRCDKKLIKRIAFRQHLVSHAKKMGANLSVVKAPDDKLPQKMVFKGTVMELCKMSCSDQPHLHCYLCGQLFIDRSMLIIHIWRCIGQVDTSPSKEPLEEDPNIKLHTSIIRRLEDLPIERCTDPQCNCNGKYHCIICPQYKFKPNFLTHLKCHYLSHWRKRVPYKGYSILICYLDCESKDGNRPMFHYHCPICGGTRRRRSGFVHHLKICQGDKLSTYRFSMNQTKNVNVGMEVISTDTQTVYDLYETNDATDNQMNFENCLSTDVDNDTLAIEEQTAVEDITDVKEMDSDIVEKSPQEDEMKIFETVTGTLSQKLVDSMNHDQLMSMLQEVTGKTGTDAEWAPGTVTPVYSLSGQPKGMLQAQNLIKKMMYNDTCKDGDSNQDDSGKCICTTHICSRCGEGLSNAVNEESFLMTDQIEKTENTEKAEIATVNKKIVKRGRGRPRKTTVNNKHIDSGKSAGTSISNEGTCRKRGRPPKQKTSVKHTNDLDYKPDSSKIITIDESVNVKSDTKRYSTRGIVKDFSAIAGMKKSSAQPVVKKEKDANTAYNIEPVQKEMLTSVPYLETDEENCENKKAVGQFPDVHTKLLSSVDEQVDSIGVSTEPSGVENYFMSDSEVAFVPVVEFNVLPSKRGRKKSKNLQSIKNENQQYSQSDDFDENEDADEDVEEDVEMSEEDKLKEYEDGLKCTVCDFSSDDFCEVSLHIKCMHENVIITRCDVCEKVFATEDHLSKHVDQNHGPFSFSDVLKKQHNMLVRKSKNKMVGKNRICKKTSDYHCSKCNFRTININRYHIHKQNIHNEMPVCEFCGKKFASFMHLGTHVQAVHTKSKASVCHVCGKNFNHVRYLKAHLKRHLGIRNHVCNICGRKFIESNTLKTHKETHKPEEERYYKFVCNYCGKRFFNKSTYSDHLNKHTGNKPYPCDICGKTFAFKSIMDKHKLFIHTAAKPYKCDFCIRAFKLKRLLAQHMVLHTGQSDFTCNGCNRAFTCKTTLKIHQQKCKGVTLGKLSAGTFIVLSEQNVGSVEAVGGISNVVNLQQPQDIILAPGEGLETIVNQSIGNSGLEDTLLVESQVVSEGTEPALYMCSECNAVFDNFSDAEKHVLVGHNREEGLVVIPPEQLDGREQLVDSGTVFSNIAEDEATAVVELSLQDAEWNTQT